jgi:hypothetical protein
VTPPRRGRGRRLRVQRRRFCSPLRRKSGTAGGGEFPRRATRVVIQNVEGKGWLSYWWRRRDNVAAGERVVYGGAERACRHKVLREHLMNARQHHWAVRDSPCDLIPLWYTRFLRFLRSGSLLVGLFWSVTISRIGKGSSETVDVCLQSRVNRSF